MQQKLTFIGHSTIMLDIEDFRIMTDPLFSKWIYGIPRVKKVNIEMNEITEKIDLILISHAHKDHLNKKSLEYFDKNVPIASHSANHRYISKYKFTNIIKYDYWETKTFYNDKIKITSVPAYHGKTLPWGPTGKSGGFIIEAMQKTIYFAGDTAYDAQLFKKIRTKFDIDVLLMPIGAYSPRWILKSEHTNPDEALKTMNILRAKIMIPIHWGSFMFALDTPKRPIKILKKRIEGTNLENKIKILKNGESIEF